MKTQTIIKAAAIVALLSSTFRIQAQIATFNNSLPCPVVVTLLEVRSGAAGSCGPGNCGNQTIVIPATGSATFDLGNHCLPSGSSFNDMCIEVTRVGSCQFNTGVHLTASCHGPVLLDSAPMAPSCCLGTPSWTATWAPGPLVFSIF